MSIAHTVTRSQNGLNGVKVTICKMSCLCENINTNNDARSQTMLKTNNFFNNQIPQEVHNRYLFLTIYFLSD